MYMVYFKLFFLKLEGLYLHRIGLRPAVMLRLCTVQ